MNLRPSGRKQNIESSIQPFVYGRRLSLLSLPKLVDGWETLQLAATNRDGAVRSVVRLNKQLAMLQREGFPVPVRFSNIDMGPASKDVEKRANHARDAGYLLVQEARIKNEFKARKDFLLTPEGHEYVLKQLVPGLKEDPRGKAYWTTYMDVMTKCQYMTNDALVDEAHKALKLDDREDFLRAYVQSRDLVDQWRQRILKSWKPRRDVDIAAAATVDFAGMALESIKSKVADEKNRETGKNHIVWNIERLLSLLELREGLNPSDGGSDKSLASAFDRVLNALELNCAIYGYLDVPDEEEIDALFMEGSASAPDEVTF